MSLPRNRIAPPRGMSAPATARKVVDLPAPLAPISATISPSAISNERSRHTDRLAIGELQPFRGEERGHAVAPPR